MTLSLAGRCAETGMLGAAVTSSSICVASRCLFTRAGVGAGLTQNVTDPSLGVRMLDLLEAGADANTAISQVVAEANHIEWRQLVLLDSSGSFALHTGEKVLGRHATAEGNQCAAAANLLANEEVPQTMVTAFEQSSGHLAQRLITALEAGIAAGGEEGPVRSAGVQVVHKVSWPVVDLRVDWDENPLPKLRTIWNEYQPQLEPYVTRALNPEAAPSYGVPGDL
tara:strand:+ start:1058 stop:1729 length:672 start_codon:yes stop_codon:yes gene_type:complete